MRQNINSDCGKYRFYGKLIKILLFLTLLCLKSTAYAQDGAERNVLFISSYSDDFIAVPEQIKGIKEAFQGREINLVREYMDTKNFSSDENLTNFYNSLKYKLDHSPVYDAIIVGDDAALQFAMDHQEELFANVPIVFFGINDKVRAETAARNPYMTGSMEETSLVENIKIAASFNPDAQKVIEIVDETLTGQGDTQQFEEASRYFSEYQFETWNIADYSYAEFGKKLEGIGNDTILIFQNMNHDKEGANLNLDQQFKFIKEHTYVPVYRASMGGVGEGLIGGKMISYEKLGEVAGNTVTRIFDGEDIKEIALIQDTPYYYYFDYNVIKEYNINEALIPQDAVLLNKNVSPLTKYKGYIIAAIAWIVVLLIFIFILFTDNMKRRKIQKELQDSNERLTAIYEELMASEEELQTQYEIVEKNAEEVKLLYEKYTVAIEGTNSAVWEFDPVTKKILISENFERVVDRTIKRPEHIYTILDRFVRDDFKEKLVTEVINHISGETDEINMQLPIKHNSLKKWILVRGKILDENKDGTRKIYGIFLDITTLKEQEEYINYLAKHDYLTDLPNRLNFMSLLNEELDKGNKGAVLLLDIDDFKSINDTLGHIYGDQLLKKVARKLLRLCDTKMSAARFGGDEFLILLKDVITTTEVEEYVHKITSIFAQNFVIQGTENYIKVSIGITFFPQDGHNSNQLIMNADTAMYQVKHNGKNNFTYYHVDMKEKVKSKKEIDLILRHALQEDGLCLNYQPQIETDTGKIIGFEALLRLRDHKISPAVFIPIAEETGHIIDIGRWVAKEAVRQIAEWREKGLEEKVIAINYSSKQLRDKKYIAYLLALLEQYKVKAENIEIEITEGILLENNEQTIAFLEELKMHGFSIALDDFGTGYSSLNYLTYIPVDKVKLDKTINDKFLSLDNSLVMDSLISLAHSLKLKITAEGIEEWDKFYKLKDSHCDYIQGYLFSKPLQKEEIEKIYNETFYRDIQENNNSV